MGTRGYRIIKFRGRYWIFYNHWDSYPHGLGQWLVDSIPTDPEQYQNWLQSQRDFFAKWDSMLKELLTIQPEDMRKLLSDEPHKAVFFAAFDDRLQTNAPPFYASSGIDGYSYGIEWTYTIDLDRQVFSVLHGAHFTLDKIPGLWDTTFFKDTEGNRFVLPQLVPAESVASLAVDPPSFNFPAHHESLQTRLVKPKNTDQSLRSYVTEFRFRWMLFDIIQELQQWDLSTDLLGWQAQDLPFRELSFFILCLASGGDHLALLDQRCMKMPYPGALYLGMPTGDSSEPEIELATYLGVGYHMSGLPIGSAPEETKYWFEGALICLVPRLKSPGILQQAIADAVGYGRSQCTTSSFNAVLISIEHLVLIKSFPDGHVDHTEVLPLIPITSHLSQDARARYGDQALEAFYAAKSGARKRKSEEPDQSDAGQLIQNLDQQENMDNLDIDDDRSAKSEEHGWKEGVENETVRGRVGAVPDGEPEDGSDSYSIAEDEESQFTSDEEYERHIKRVAPIPVNDVSTKSTFMALVQFFETIKLETLRPAQPNEARLPDEICEMVLHSVSDKKTYNSCLKVSRRFRLICQQRPLVIDNVIFKDPWPRKKGASIHGKEDEKVTSDGENLPDFLAVEMSSNRQMNAWLRSGIRNKDFLTCFVVAGHEWNRKTVVSRCIYFQGLRVPLASADKARKRKRDTLVPTYDEEREMHGSEGTLWEFPFKYCHINIESETREIGDFWNQILRSLELHINEPGEAWSLPPNTVHYFGKVTSYDESYHTSIEFFNFLYLRVKRLGMFCDSQWDDIIRETTEQLNKTKEDDSRNCPEGGVVGGEEPFVMLVVGLEARLFKWVQGHDESVDKEERRTRSPFSALRELNPGRFLNVYEKSDREDIERFLKRAGEHGKAIEARK